MNTSKALRLLLPVLLAGMCCALAACDDSGTPQSTADSDLPNTDATPAPDSDTAPTPSSDPATGTDANTGDDTETGGDTETGDDTETGEDTETEEDSETGDDSETTPVAFTATTGADAVVFHDRSADTFTTTRHQPAVHAHYTLDLRWVELAAHDTLRVGDFLFASDTALAGADLATALDHALNDPAAENVPPGWTFAAADSTLSLTATDAGPQDAPEIAYEHGLLTAVQAVNLADIRLAPGQSLTVHDSATPGDPPTALYTNDTGDDLNGAALATAIAANTPSIAWTLHAEGSRLYFTSLAPGAEQPLLAVARPYDGGTVALDAECKTRYSYDGETTAIIAQLTPGSGGDTIWQAALTETDEDYKYAQTLYLSGLSLAPGHTLRITAQKETGNVLRYTNARNDTLMSYDLLDALYYDADVGSHTWDRFDATSIDTFEETLTFRSSNSNASPLTAHIHAPGALAVYTIDFSDTTVLPNDGIHIDDTSIGVGVVTSGAALANIAFASMTSSSMWTPDYETGSALVTLTAKLPGPATPTLSHFDMGREAQLHFSGVTLAAGETIHIGNYRYTAATDLNGTALAEALHADLVGRGVYAFSDAIDWTVRHRDGSPTLFLVTDNNRTISVTSPIRRYTDIIEETVVGLVSQAGSGGYNPRLATDFSLPISFGNKVLVPGASLRIGDYAFANTTGDTLEGLALAEAVRDDLLLPENALAIDGVTAWRPETYSQGAIGWLRIATDGISVSYSRPAGEDALTVFEVVPGSGGGTTFLGLVTVSRGAVLTPLTSGLNALDVITDFQIGEDRIAISNAEIHYLVVDETALASAHYQGFRYVCHEGLSYSVGAHQAGLFALDGDHYLLVNDGTASFDPDKDIVIKLVGLKGYRHDLQVQDIFDLSL